MATEQRLHEFFNWTDEEPTPKPTRWITGFRRSMRALATWSGMTWSGSGR